ncbi:unnamed protein product, partial [Staurois parvus]
ERGIPLHRAGISSYFPAVSSAPKVYRPGNSAQGWWEPLIMGTEDVQTRELSTGMVGTPHNEHRRCTDPGTQHRDGGNPS